MDYKKLRLKKKRTPTSRSRKKGKASLIKKVLLIIFLLGLITFMAGGGLFAFYASQAPALNEEELITPVPSEILDKNGKIIATIGTKKRDLVKYKNIPSLVENAVLATEDSRFYDHIGVDPIRIGGAVIANLTEGLGSEGGSTITQQVVKRAFLTPEKTLERKAQEAWLALKLDNKYSKEKIFEMYVNKIYYSDNIYGIRTASNYYFGKELQDLTLAQAALLAGIPQSPNNYNPYDYPERAKERRNIVLLLMEQHGKITQQEMEEAQQVPITEGLVSRTKEERSTLAGRKGDEAFVDVVLDEIEQHGDYDLFSDGLRVHTTMDPNAQEYMEKILNTEEVIQYPEDKNGEPFQAGITLLETQTGAVRAIGGGRDYGEKAERGFNFATDAARQPGSVIKPLIAYAPAIEKMKWSTAHILIDEPIEFENGKKPRNWDNQFVGPVSIREALWDSRNIPAIKTFNQVGHEYAATFINQLGFNVEEPLPESAAIGGSKLNTNSYEMAGAYAALGNGGTYTKPYTITKIELRDGTTIDTIPESNKTMEPHTAYMVTDMLKSVIEHPEGTGRRAEINGLPLAGKSGTTSYSSEMREEFNLDIDHSPDSWFIGYTTEYTASVWTGYEHKENYLTAEERKTSQKIFKALMEEVSSKSDTSDFDQPADVVEVKIEDGTNPPKLASAFTPEELVTKELFVEGTAPTETSDEYVPDLEAPVNLSVDYNRAEKTVRLSWDHVQEEEDNRQVTFEVTKAENGGEKEVISSTEQHEISIEAIQPENSYTFSVTATSQGNRSEPAAIEITPQDMLPEQQPEQPAESETEQQPEQPAEPETEQQPEQPAESETEQQPEQPAESETEQQSEQPAESDAEQQSEQPTESDAEQQSEQPTESDAEQQSEQPAESDAEQQSEQPTESDAEQQDEQTAEPDAEQQDEQTAEPDAEQQDEQTAEPDAEQQDEQTAEPGAEQQDEQTAEPDAEQQAEQTAEPDAEQQGEPEVEQQSEQPNESQQNQQAEQPTESEQQTEQPAEPASNGQTNEPDPVEENTDQTEAEQETPANDSNGSVEGNSSANPPANNPNAEEVPANSEATE